MFIVYFIARKAGSYNNHLVQFVKKVGLFMHGGVEAFKRKGTAKLCHKNCSEKAVEKS